MITITILYETHHGVLVQNLKNLNQWLNENKKLKIEVLVLYYESLHLRQLKKKYPELRFWRLKRKPTYPYFLHQATRTMRGSILIYISNSVLLAKRDIFYLASVVQKPMTPVANLTFQKFHPPFLKLKKPLCKQNIFQHCFNNFHFAFQKARWIYFQYLNSPYNLASFEIISFNINTLNKGFKNLNWKEKKIFLKGEYVFFTKDGGPFDLFFDHYLKKNKMHWANPGRAHSVLVQNQKSINQYLPGSIYKIILILWKKTFQFDDIKFIFRKFKIIYSDLTLV